MATARRRRREAPPGEALADIIEAPTRFGDYEVDLGRFELRRSGLRVRVQPKVLDLLVYLIRDQERVVPKEELLQALWRGVSVSETALGALPEPVTLPDEEARFRLCDVLAGVLRALAARAPLVIVLDDPHRADPSSLDLLPALLHELALEARAGRLRSRPRTVSSSGEPLLPGVRADIEQSFDVHVNDAWGASEALTLGHSCGSGAGLHVGMIS